jgi:hypothetical protein
MASVTFQSHAEFSDVIAALHENGRLDMGRTLMLTALVTARRRRASGRGIQKRQTAG